METRFPKGQILIETLVITGIAGVVIPILIVVAMNNLRESARIEQSELAFHIAEAGIEYYRWHLAHAPADFTDGTGAAGPYIHNYADREGQPLGRFELTITPPSVGSTVVDLRSKGIASGTPLTVRTIDAKMAIPSLAKYAVVVNDNIRFGPGTTVNGPIHSNQGIRFDGTAYGIVASALSEYNDPDHEAGDEFSVHTHRNPPPDEGVDDSFRPLEAPPNPVQNRNDVFIAGRQFPVPAVDFAGLTADLAQIKSDAQSGGLYFANSGALGYRVALKPDNTFDLYRVTSLVPTPNGCTRVLGQDGWGTWSIQSEAPLGSYPFPANGLVFLEDDVWVSGQIDAARLTIAAGRFPDTPGQRKSITVNNDVQYTNYDGRDALAMIAQGNFNAGLVSEDDLRIDGAIVAQNGRVGRYYYRPPDEGKQNRCWPYHVRQIITLYGMIMSNERYGFAYSDGTGYQTRNINYDANLLYGPPPSFPLTSDQYETIFWEEVR